MASFSQSFSFAFNVSSPSSLTFDLSFSSSVLANDGDEVPFSTLSEAIAHSCKVLPLRPCTFTPSVFKHQSPRPQILPQQQPKPEEYFSLSSQSNVKVMVSPRKTSPLSPIPPPEQRQNNCSQQQQSTSSATNGHHRYQPPSNNNSSANSTFASSSSSATTTTSHSEAPIRGHRSQKQTLPQLDVSPPNPQNELPDSDDQEPAADKVPPPPPPPPPPPNASTSSSSSTASAPLPSPPL